MKEDLNYSARVFDGHSSGTNKKLKTKRKYKFKAGVSHNPGGPHTPFHEEENKMSKKNVPVSKVLKSFLESIEDEKYNPKKNIKEMDTGGSLLANKMGSAYNEEPEAAGERASRTEEDELDEGLIDDGLAAVKDALVQIVGKKQMSAEDIMAAFKDAKKFNALRNQVIAGIESRERRQGAAKPVTEEDLDEGLGDIARAAGEGLKKIGSAAKDIIAPGREHAYARAMARGKAAKNRKLGVASELLPREEEDDEMEFEEAINTPEVKGAANKMLQVLGTDVFSWLGNLLGSGEVSSKDMVAYLKQKQAQNKGKPGSKPE
jgi:hypothetical protein